MATSSSVGQTVFQLSTTGCFQGALQRVRERRRTSGWTNQPKLFWYYDMVANGGGLAAGQFAIVNNSDGVPCLVAFTDNTDNGTYFISAAANQDAGCQ